MTILYFDYETNGFPKKPIGNSFIQDGQARAVQLGAVLVKDNRTIAELNLIINNNVEINEHVVAVHGISKQMCTDLGVSAKLAHDLLLELIKRADLYVSHNWAFDEKIATIENEYLGYAPFWNYQKSFCTMEATTPLLKLPSAKGGFKWPKLTEAYQHYFGETFDNAHDAMADVRALRRLHKHLLANKLI